MSITVQSTYSTTFTKGYAGMIADGAQQNVVSRIIEDSAGIAFGKAAFQGTADKGVTATVGTKFRGITVADVGVITPVGGAADLYAQYATANLLDEGDIWVTVGANVAVGAAAYVTSAGVFTSSSSGNTAL